MGITNINGIAITASLASTASAITITFDGGTAPPSPVLFAQNSGSRDVRSNSELYYLVLSQRLHVPNISSSGQIIAASFTGSLLGTSSWAANAITASRALSASQVNTINTTTNATFFPTFVDSANGTSTAENVFTNTTFTFNPSTDELRADLINNNTGGSNTSTADANLTIDASLTQSMYWVASFTTTRSLVVNNLTQGRHVRVYIRNTNATQRQIIFSGSTTTSSHGLINMAVNAGAASVTTQNFVANSGTGLATIENIGGFIVGGLM
jgi:hypothetical protein